MGKRIVYCQDCGKSLREDAFDQGKAHTIDDRPYCSECRPPPPPEPKSRPPSAPLPRPLSPHTRRIAVAPAPKARPTALLVGGAAGGALLLIVLVVVIASGGDAPAPPPAPPPPAPPRAEAAPPPTPDPPRRARDARAEEVDREMAAQQEKERARKFDEFLAQIRGMIAEDKTFARRVEVSGMIESALRAAGGRRGEVERLKAEYEKEFGEHSRRRTLEGHWRLDEGSGTRAADASIHGRHGTVKGASWIQGRIRGGLQFDGTDDHVEVPNHADLSPHAGPGGEMTVAAWIRVSEYPPASGQGRAPFVAKGDTRCWEYALYLYANGSAGVSIWQPDGTGYAETNTGLLSKGEWHHVAVAVKKGQFVSLYVDGKLRSQATEFKGETFAGASPFYIGRRGGQQFFKGEVDDVRLYSRPLTALELQELYEAGLAGRD